MVLCPGILKNGRPCTNELEERNKFCKMCGWKVDPEIFEKIAVSCPNKIRTVDYSGKCGTWIEKGQSFCDQCGWEVDQSVFINYYVASNSGQMKENSEKTDFYNQVLQMVDTLATRNAVTQNYPGPYPISNSTETVSGASGMDASNHGGEGSSTVFVSHLNEEKVTPDGLFNLFGCFGNVLIVKILYNRRDTALIQMETGEQAKTAIQYLDNFKLWDENIVVQISQVSGVHCNSGSEMTRNFTDCRLHRVKLGSKICLDIQAPSAVLFLRNMLPTITKEDVQEAFSEFGKVTHCKMLDRQKGTALVQLGSKEEAALALMAMHNFTLPDNQHMKVSFSKHDRIL